MEENLEIYFCEICSESIAAKDLATKEAIELKGKVIGPCCLAGIRQPQSRTAGATAGLTALGVFVLAAIAGATMFLEWRLSEQVAVLQGNIDEVETNVASSGSKQIADFEKALDGTMQRGELKPLATRLDEIEGKVGTVETRLGAKFGSLNAQLGGLDEAQRKIISGQSEIRSDVKDIESELMRLEREVRQRGSPRRARVSPTPTSKSGLDDRSRRRKPESRYRFARRAGSPGHATEGRGRGQPVRSRRRVDSIEERGRRDPPGPDAQGSRCVRAPADGRGSRVVPRQAIG